MKVAFVGKGGSGKTTLAGLFARYLHQQLEPTGALPLLAIDADINQHLAAALGASPQIAAELPAMGEQLPFIKEYLRGHNPRIRSADEMVKTTPPGQGSRLLRVAQNNPLYAAFVRQINGIPLAVTGAFAQTDLGVACYHSKVGAVELLLNHLIDKPGEYVVVDMTAGADAFASGLFTRFDVTFLVCEPTLRSVSVYRQYCDYARNFGIALRVIGNKIDDDSDVAFLRQHVGSDLLAWMGRSGFVKSLDRGEALPLTALEPANKQTLSAMRAAVDAQQKDWAVYTAQARLFHERNALAWANARADYDLRQQIDPDFAIDATLVG